MVVVIGLVIALIGFAIMSRPFKIGFGLYLAFLAYYIYLYGGKGGLEEASTAFSLVSGAVALVVRQLQVRKSSSTTRRLLR